MRNSAPGQGRPVGVKRRPHEAQVMYLHMAVSDTMAMSIVIIKHQFIVSVLEMGKNIDLLNC